MCGELVTIASLDPDRFVAHCNCGCLHLVWRQLTLRVHMDDLSRVLTQLRPSLRQNSEGGSVHVWLGVVGLHLRYGEFEGLMTLLEDAQQALAQLPPSRLRPRQRDILGLLN
jgi:hypothetical protein